MYVVLELNVNIDIIVYSNFSFNWIWTSNYPVVYLEEIIIDIHWFEFREYQFVEFIHLSKINETHIVRSIKKKKKARICHHRLFVVCGSFDEDECQCHVQLG